MAGDAGVAVEDRAEAAADVFGLHEIIPTIQEQVQLLGREARQRIPEPREHGRDGRTTVTDVVRQVGTDRGSLAGMTGDTSQSTRPGLSGRSEHRQQGDDARIHWVGLGFLRGPLALP